MEEDENRLTRSISFFESAADFPHGKKGEAQ